MNLGVYIPTLKDQHRVKEIFEAINHGLDNSLLSDASIFFDDVSYNEHQVKCGLFNASELWNFSGSLVTTSISTTLSATKIVNNIKLYYYYGWEDLISPLTLIFLTKEQLSVICDSQESRKDFYRKTGKQPLGVCENFYELIQMVRT